MIEILLASALIVLVFGLVPCAITIEKLRARVAGLEHTLKIERFAKKQAEEKKVVAESALNSNREFFLRHRIETGNWKGYGSQWTHEEFATRKAQRPAVTINRLREYVEDIKTNTELHSTSQPTVRVPPHPPNSTQTPYPAHCPDRQSPHA